MLILVTTLYWKELIEQLDVDDQRARGPPPAPPSSINALPTIKISQAHVRSNDLNCPICQEKFELGSEAREMPCNHIYHSDCIVPWLVQHNSCPICRVELPPQLGHASSRGNRSRGGRNRQHNHGRRNPLLCLWPFCSSS